MKDKVNLGEIVWGEKHLTYLGTRIRITKDFSSEAMQTRSPQSEMLTVLKINK